MKGPRKTKLNTLERPGKGELPPPPQNAAELREYTGSQVVRTPCSYCGGRATTLYPPPKNPPNSRWRWLNRVGGGQSLRILHPHWKCINSYSMVNEKFFSTENETWNLGIGVCKDIVYKRRIKENSNRGNAKLNEKLCLESKDEPNVLCYFFILYWGFPGGSDG